MCTHKNQFDVDDENDEEKEGNKKHTYTTGNAPHRIEIKVNKVEERMQKKRKEFNDDRQREHLQLDIRGL